MKVLHVISGGDTGGAKTSVLILIESLNVLGVETKLLCFMESVFTKEAREKGFDVVILPQKNRFDLSVTQSIKTMIEAEGFELINAHGARANFVLSAMKKHIKVPVLTTIHSDYRHDFDHNFIKKILFTALNGYSLRRMDGYITMSEYFKRIMIEQGFDGRKIQVAYNGVPMVDQEIPDKEAFLGSYNIPYDSNKLYVGIASRLHPIKGVDVFIRGAAEVLKHNKQVVFVIAGYGEKKYENQYKMLAHQLGISDGLHFIGFVEDIHDFYKVMDINTNTSHSEAVCYALLEGGSLKKPTVASAVGGSVELIENEVDGLLFEDNDHQGFAKQISKLYEDRAAMKTYGEALYKKVDTQFSTKAMGNGYKRIYEKYCEDMK